MKCVFLWLVVAMAPSAAYLRSSLCSVIYVVIVYLLVQRKVAFGTSASMHEQVCPQYSELEFTLTAV